MSKKVSEKHRNNKTKKKIKKIKKESKIFSKKDNGKFFLNRRTNFHPSLTIGYDKEGNWINRPITHSKRSSFRKLNKNPNPNDSRDAFIKISAKKDKANRKGKLLKNYRLSKEDKDWLNLENKKRD